MSSRLEYWAFYTVKFCFCFDLIVTVPWAGDFGLHKEAAKTYESKPVNCIPPQFLLLFLLPSVMDYNL